MLFKIVLVFFCCYSKDSMKKALVTQEMAPIIINTLRGKSHGPNGQEIKFYIKLWPTIGQSFLDMINQSLEHGNLPKGMNNGIIVLLHKEGALDSLTNYRPITLLNVSYKILAKALQIRLKSLDEDQTTFLPLRYILDNVLTRVRVCGT